MFTPYNIILVHYFRQILEKAHAAGIDIIPLKGAHLITSVYPHAESRGTMADIDFLVQPHDWQPVCRLLTEMGFQLRTVSGRKKTLDIFYQAGFQLPLPGGQWVLMEPHRQLVQPSRHPVDYDSLWQRSYASTFEGAPCRRMVDDDHLLHCVIHLFTHRFDGLTRALRDIELLLENGNLSLKAVSARARQWKCRHALWLALTLLRQKKQHATFNALIEESAPALPIQYALTRLVHPDRGFKFAGAGLRLEEAILWPFLMDDMQQGIGFVTDFLMLRLRDRLWG